MFNVALIQGLVASKEVATETGTVTFTCGRAKVTVYRGDATVTVEDDNGYFFEESDYDHFRDALACMLKALEEIGSG